MTPPTDPVREQLVRVLGWDEAHVGFDEAVDKVAADRRGALAAGFDHSLWQLLEHMRLAQHDLLEFCVNARYEHTLSWPGDYWPGEPAPPDAASWTASIAGFKTDRERLIALARDPRVDLFATVPTGKAGQSYARAILLVIDHNAYHLGQFVAVRRALGIWR